MAMAVAIYGVQRYYHGASYSSANLLRIAVFYVIFLAVDYLTCIVAFTLERHEEWKLLLWLFWQRMVYRQVMYYIAIKSVFAAIRGQAVSWGKVERKATVSLK